MYKTQKNLNLHISIHGNFWISVYLNTEIKKFMWFFTQIYQSSCIETWRLENMFSLALQNLLVSIHGNFWISMYWNTEIQKSGLEIDQSAGGIDKWRGRCSDSWGRFFGHIHLGVMTPMTMSKNTASGVIGSLTRFLPNCTYILYCADTENCSSYIVRTKKGIRLLHCPNNISLPSFAYSTLTIFSNF